MSFELTIDFSKLIFTTSPAAMFIIAQPHTVHGNVSLIRVFHKKHNIGNIANFVFLNIYNFLLDLHDLILVNTKLDVTGSKRIIFQGCRLHWFS